VPSIPSISSLQINLGRIKQQQQYPFNGPLFDADITEAGDSELQWHKIGHMQMCTSPRQITTPASHRSVFTHWMPFLPPNQQHQSTEGTSTLLLGRIKMKLKQHDVT